ncbi:MAG TPA: hypothetical protein VFG98_10050 [Intrasporangium sp.]|nr:hypothetical protein [Intrasporangium sp.]
MDPVVKICTHDSAFQPRIVMPAGAAFEASAWMPLIDRVRTTALVQGATPGTSVWSSPPG